MASAYKTQPKDDNQLLDEIRQMTLANLHTLTKDVRERAKFMDPSSPDYDADFKFVWGFTRETMKVIPGLEPKQEAGPQLVIDVSSLPGIAEALQKPPVSALPDAHVIDMPPDAPEPKFGASDVPVKNDPSPQLLDPPEKSVEEMMDAIDPNDIDKLLGDFQ